MQPPSQLSEQSQPETSESDASNHVPCKEGPALDELSEREIHKKYVFDFYESVASHFSHTRYKPWPNVKSFVESIYPEDCLLVDLGSGNGKNIMCFPGFSIGLDSSPKLNEIAKQNCTSKSDFITADISRGRLPLRSAGFRSSICIAVLHHIRLESTRKWIMQEFCRLLAPGGSILIYVWAKEQQETSIGYRNMEGKSDLLVPWVKSNAGSNLRFCHPFDSTELTELISSCTGFSIVRSYYDSNNWAVIAKRV